MHFKGPSLNSNTFEAFQSSFLLRNQDFLNEELIVNPDVIEFQKPKSQNLISAIDIFASNKKDDESISGDKFSQKMGRIPLIIHFKRDNSFTMPLVKKFISKLRNSVGLRNLDQSKSSDLAFLNDSTAFLKTDIQSLKTKNKLILFFDKSLKRFKSFSQIKKVFKFFQNNNTVLSPYHSFKIIWDFLHLILIVYWFFCIPLLLVDDEVQNKEKIGAFLSTMFLISDVVLNFNTAYFKKGLLERGRWKIFDNYWRNNLKYDLITLLPIISDCYFGDLIYWGLHLWKFIFFFKIFTCQEISSRILEKFLLKEKFQNLMALLKIFFISVLVAHIFACFWLLTATSSSEKYPNNWISEANLLEKSWEIKYLYSFYWASVTMMTVGYGDITPTNESEVVVCIISVVLGCVVYAYNISSIGIILQELNKENVEFNRKINIINQFMNRKNINGDLQRRIREYLGFLWKEENTQNLEQEQKILDFLSGSLKEELYIDAYGSLLKNEPMFMTNFTENSLRKIVSRVKEIRLLPDEKVFFENENDDTSIYFIIKGRVELFSKIGNSEIIYQELGVGNHFGELSFFSGKPRSCSARSKDFTTLFSIERNDFLRVLENNSEDNEKFSMIRDQIMLYNNYDPLKTCCFCCKQRGHLAGVCPKFHFIPDCEKVIKKLTFYNDQKRAPFIRKARKINSFLSKPSLNTASLKIKETIIKERTDEQLKLKSIHSSEEEVEDDVEMTADESGASNNQMAMLPIIEENSENESSKFFSRGSIDKIDKAQEKDVKKYDACTSNVSPLLRSVEETKIEKKQPSLNEHSKSIMINRVFSSEGIKTDQNSTNNFERTMTKKKTEKDVYYENSAISNAKIGSLAYVKNPHSNFTFPEKILSFENVKNFKNYFPEQNCIRNIEKFNKINLDNSLKNKENQRKIMQKKLRWAKYTFFVEEMRKHMLERSRKRKSIVKKKKRDGIILQDIKLVINTTKKSKTNLTTSIENKFSDFSKKSHKENNT